jgi:hypothetical protein
VRYSGAGLRTEVIRIPVVVHVIHNTASQNIPKKHIDSQINVLDDDFRRLNSPLASHRLRIRVLPGREPARRMSNRLTNSLSF